MLNVRIDKLLGDFNLQAEFTAGNEILGILGPSGSGKSLTLRSIAGIETPDCGYISVNGRVLFDAAMKVNIPPRQRKIGYVFQQHSLFPHLTVKENIEFGLRDLSWEERHSRVTDMLQTIHLEHRANYYPRQLSGGQQQRVALARTLVTRPDLLMLDEPFSALDAYLKRHLENELLELIHSHFSGTVLLVTHDIEEAHRLCDRILVYSDGVSVQIGKKQEIMDAPATLDVAQVIGCRNLFPACVASVPSTGSISNPKNATDSFPDSSTPVPTILHIGELLLRCATIPQPGSNVTVGFHGSHVALSRQRSDLENEYACRIIELLEGTFAVSVVVNCCEIRVFVDMDRSSWHRLGCGPGDLLFAHIPAEKVFLLPTENASDKKAPL